MLFKRSFYICDVRSDIQPSRIIKAHSLSEAIESIDPEFEGVFDKRSWKAFMSPTPTVLPPIQPDRLTINGVQFRDGRVAQDYMHAIDASRIVDIVLYAGLVAMFTAGCIYALCEWRHLLSAMNLPLH